MSKMVWKKNVLLMVSYQQLNGFVQEGRKGLFWVIFFSFQSAWIFACAFQLSSKPFPCIFFLADLHFISEKNEDKILKRAQWTQQSQTRAFQSKKNTECFSTKLKSTCKNSGTFEGKHFYPKKSLTSLLHQANFIIYLTQNFDITF